MNNYFLTYIWLNTASNQWLKEVEYFDTFDNARSYKDTLKNSKSIRIEDIVIGTVISRDIPASK